MSVLSKVVALSVIQRPTEVTNPNLRMVDEVGLAMLSPGGGHGIARSANLSTWSCSPTRCLVKQPHA